MKGCALVQEIKKFDDIHFLHKTTKTTAKYDIKSEIFQMNVSRHDCRNKD